MLTQRGRPGAVLVPAELDAAVDAAGGLDAAIDVLRRSAARQAAKANAGGPVTCLPPHPADGPHTLYRAVGEFGIVLYIGISRGAGGRLADHERESRWWPEVRSVTFETWPTLEAARIAEPAAIWAKHPVHNKTRFRTQWPTGAVRQPSPAR
jgi:hypothetical protein